MVCRFPLLFALLVVFSAMLSAKCEASSIETDLQAHLLHLSKITDDDPPSLSRPTFSNASLRAREYIRKSMQEVGLHTEVDGAGNVRGSTKCGYERTLLLGSHFDTVRNAGMWDGVYGVMASILMVREMVTRHGCICAILPFDLMLIAFDDEEGNNHFGSTNLGAKAIAGVLDIFKDVSNMPAFLHAYSKAFDVRGHLSIQLNRLQEASLQKSNILAYIELHIEQGPVLEARDIPLAAVTSIAGQTRLSLSVHGTAGHAGTIPMNLRQDPLMASAQLISAVEAAALSHSSLGVVATVGKLKVLPGVTNVIPSSVTLSIDVRAPTDKALKDTVSEIEKYAKRLEQDRGVQIDIATTHQMPSTLMTPWVRHTLEKVATRVNAGPNAPAYIMSGAGHDAQVMAQLTDVGMLFVRCRHGISHSPEEHVDLHDAAAGVAALQIAVEEIAHRYNISKDLPRKR